ASGFRKLYFWADNIWQFPKERKIKKPPVGNRQVVFYCPKKARIGLPCLARCLSATANGGGREGILWSVRQAFCVQAIMFLASGDLYGGLYF
ncbi:hypothetical protein, partial [uncultured Sutterella sp.]|uniref:hypothetical protein n=1 Tax=uncultured Sutterella sp. TaxID=286133 RepID=UPI0025EA1459